MAFACSVCYDLLVIDPSYGDRRPPTPRNNPENNENEVPCLVTTCGHTFHSYCITRWFETSGVFSNARRECPFCRTSLPGDDDVHILHLDALEPSSVATTGDVVPAFLQINPSLALLKDDLDAALNVVNEIEEEEKVFKDDLANLKRQLDHAARPRSVLHRSRSGALSAGADAEKKRLEESIAAKTDDLAKKASELHAANLSCFNLIKAIQLFEQTLGRIPIPAPPEPAASGNSEISSRPEEPVASAAHAASDSAVPSASTSANVQPTETRPEIAQPSRTGRPRGGTNQRGRGRSRVLACASQALAPPLPLPLSTVPRPPPLLPSTIPGRIPPTPVPPLVQRSQISRMVH